MIAISKLRILRKMAEDTLDDVARETGLSVGYLNRIERGFVTEIKNVTKLASLQKYLKSALNDGRLLRKRDAVLFDE